MKNTYTKKILIVVVLLVISVGGYVWISALKNDSNEVATNNKTAVSKVNENEVKQKNTNNVQTPQDNKTKTAKVNETVKVNETAKVNEESKVSQNLPEQTESREKTSVVLKQSQVTTVAKDTVIELIDYAEFFGHRSGVIVELSDPNAVEVLSETPNMIPTIMKIKSDVTVKVITETNTVTFDLKVK